MRTIHDLKDLAMIYDDCDKYEVSVWQPHEQRRMRLTFCGSSKPCEEYPNGVINFIATYQDEIGENCVMEAFRSLMVREGLVKEDNNVKDLEKLFLKEILNLRATKKEKE